MENNTDSSPLECDDNWLIIPLMSAADRVNLYIIATLQIVFGIISIFFNSLTIVAINKAQQGDRHCTILRHLCIADLSCNLTTQPVYTVILFMQAVRTGRDKLCAMVLFINISGLFLCFASFSLLLFVTAERCLVILMPFRHEKYKSSKIIPVTVALTWLTSAALIALLQIPILRKYAALFLLGFLIFGGVFISIAYIILLCMARRVRRQIQRQCALSGVYTKGDAYTVGSHNNHGMSTGTARSALTNNNVPNATTVLSMEVARNIPPASANSTVEYCSSSEPQKKATAANEEILHESSMVVLSPVVSPEIINETSTTLDHKITLRRQNSISNATTFERLEITGDSFSRAFNTKPRNPRQTTGKPRRSERLRMRPNVAKLTSLVCATCLICYVPFVVCAALYTIKMIICRLLLQWMWTVLLMSSTLTPVLFGFLNNELRTQMFRIWKIRILN